MTPSSKQVVSIGPAVSTDRPRRHCGLKHPHPSSEEPKHPSQFQHVSRYVHCCCFSGHLAEVQVRLCHGEQEPAEAFGNKRVRGLSWERYSEQGKLDSEDGKPFMSWLVELDFHNVRVGPRFHEMDHHTVDEQKHDEQKSSKEGNEIKVKFVHEN